MERTGGPEVMAVADVNSPEPGPGEALVAVESAGVNFIDVYLREGRYPSALPFTPGQEAAGTVVQVGDGVMSVKSGDRVGWWPSRMASPSSRQRPRCCKA